MSKYISLIFVISFTLSHIELHANNIIQAKDDAITLTSDKVTRISILDNDNIQGKISRIVVTPAKYGRALLNLDNTVTYIPSKEICGLEDSFSYMICKGEECTEAKVYIQKPCTSLKIITGFSRNTEAKFSTFTIYGLENYEQYQLSIFTTAGNQVFFSNDYKNDWNGDFNGEPLASGLYYFIIELDDGTTENGYVQIED